MNGGGKGEQSHEEAVVGGGGAGWEQEKQKGNENEKAQHCDVSHTKVPQLRRATNEKLSESFVL